MTLYKLELKFVTDNNVMRKSFYGATEDVCVDELLQITSLMDEGNINDLLMRIGRTKYNLENSFEGEDQFIRRSGYNINLLYNIRSIYVTGRC